MPRANDYFNPALDGANRTDAGALAERDRALALEAALKKGMVPGHGRCSACNRQAHSTCVSKGCGCDYCMYHPGMIMRLET